jgi:sugar phosphate isomerase/epimerase
VNPDIGHFTAAGYDAVAYIRENHARISNLHVKYRLRNRVANTRWGDGNTRIKEVLRLLQKEKYRFRANIEYEYQGTDSVIEVAKCLQYCRRDVLVV